MAKWQTRDPQEPEMACWSEYGAMCKSPGQSLWSALFTLHPNIPAGLALKHIMKQQYGR